LAAGSIAEDIVFVIGPMIPVELSENVTSLAHIPIEISCYYWQMPVEHKSIQDVVNKNNHKALQRRLMILMKSGTGRFAHLLHEHLSIVNKSSRSGDLRICKFGWMIKFRSCFCPPSLHFSQVLIFYTRCF